MKEQKVGYHILLFGYDSVLGIMNRYDPFVLRRSQMKGRSRVQDFSMIEIQGLTALIKANRSQIVKLSLGTVCS